MKNLTIELKTFTGETVKDQTGKPVTAKTAIAESLIINKQESGELKLRKYRLATQVYESGPEGIKLVSEDITLIKQSVAEVYGPIVYGQIHDILEG